jgi:hypothetical protein
MQLISLGILSHDSDDSAEPIDREDYLAFLNSTIQSRAPTPPNSPTREQPHEEQRNSQQITSQTTSQNATRLLDDWAEVPWREQRVLPEYIHSLSVYPLSSIFATCFHDELQDLLHEWCDENGNLLNERDQHELNMVLKRMHLLENSIDHLQRVCPVGR